MLDVSVRLQESYVTRPSGSIVVYILNITCHAMPWCANRYGLWITLLVLIHMGLLTANHQL